MGLGLHWGQEPLQINTGKMRDWENEPRDKHCSPWENEGLGLVPMLKALGGVSLAVPHTSLPPL